MTYSVVFCGSADFGIPALRALVADERFNVEYAVCNEAKPVGRKQELKLPPLGVAAEELGLEVLTPANKQELERVLLERERPDFLVVIAYGMLLTQPVLDWPKVAPINLHASLLPKYRGASPIQATLLNGDAEAGNCYMQMTAGLDEGPVYVRSLLDLDGTETAGDLFATLADLGAKELPDVLAEIAADKLQAQPQKGEASYCGKIKKADGQVNWAGFNAVEVINRYRAYSPWPGLYWFDENGKRVLIREIGFNAEDKELSPAQLMLDEEKRVWIGAQDLAVELILVQPEGKKAMPASEWLNGLS